MSVLSQVDRESPYTLRWQRRLLPFMTGSIVAMGAFFFIASLAQLYFLHRQLDHRPLDLRPVFVAFEAGKEPAALDADYLRWKMSVLLEQELIARRYHQAHSAMLARVWTRYLGFITGMILALVGAAFILGKLQEAPTKLDAESSVLKASLSTSSPGIVLATLGSALMAMTILVPFEIETRDTATYVRALAGVTALPPPVPLDVGPADPKERERQLFGDTKPKGPETSSQNAPGHR